LPRTHRSHRLIVLWLCSPALAMTSSFSRFLGHTQRDKLQSIGLL
jgi:hypothetical protein